MTATEVRDTVMDVALGQIGTLSTVRGSYEHSKYGVAANWKSDWLNPDVLAWQGLYCNRFTSWCVDQVVGDQAARAAIGRQEGTVLPAGHAWTVKQREWYLANNRWVGFVNAQYGDDVLYKLPGRAPEAPTNHIGRFVRWRIPGKVAVVVEANLPRPGHGTQTIGVWEHYRDITHVVAVYRPDWGAAARVYNKQHPDPIPEPKPTPMPPEEDVMTPEQEKKILDAITRGAVVKLDEGARARIGTGIETWREADLTVLTAGRLNDVRARQWSVVKAAIDQGAADPKEIADAIRADVVAAIQSAGGGATAEQIVDELVARLAGQED